MDAKPEVGVLSRSVTPTPSRVAEANGDANTFRTGMLTVRVFSGKHCLSLLFIQTDHHLGRGLSLAPGVAIPDVIQSALQNAPSSRKSISNRDSLQRRAWWLPYVVLSFDNNEVLIDALGGDISSPIWNYRADL